MPIYMKYPNANGDVKATGYENYIECSSFQYGVGRTIPAPTVGAGADRETDKAHVSEIILTKTMDGATPALYQESLKGKGKEVLIAFVEGTESRLYTKYTLTNTLISSYTMSSGGERPSESLSLNFTEIMTEFFQRDAEHDDGDQPKVKYNLATNELS